MRATNDVDFAIAVDRWGEFERLAECLRTDHNFDRVADDGHRLFSPERTQVDLVPFGGVEMPDRVIQWPSDEHRVLTTLGLREVSSHTVTARIDGELEVQVASLPGLAVLKLLAWKYRKAETTRDAEDFCRLLKTYYDVAGARLWENHEDLLDEEEFDVKEIGARMLGRDSASILQQTQELEATIRDLLAEQTAEPDASELAEAMECFVLEEVNFHCLQAFRTGVEEGKRR